MRSWFGILRTIPIVYAYTDAMVKRRTSKNRLPPSWALTVTVLLLLVVVLASISPSPVAVCGFLLLPVFLFALIELPSCNWKDRPELVSGFEDGSPSLFQRPPPTFA